jgi:hypothetical protein
MEGVDTLKDCETSRNQESDSKLITTVDRLVYGAINESLHSFFLFLPCSYMTTKIEQSKVAPFEIRRTGYVCAEQSTFKALTLTLVRSLSPLY